VITEFPATKLTLTDVGMSRGNYHLFSGVSFELTPGQVLWVHGDNGIGKTTLLRIASGFTPPETGTASYSMSGQSCKPENIIAYQGHQTGFKAKLTVQEELSFWAKLHGFNGQLPDIFTLIGLGEKLSVPTGSLSAGQKRRLGLGRLIISQKPVWIMDEPAASLDAEGSQLTEMIISDHTARGGSVIIASHSPAKVLGQNARRLTLRAAS